MKWKRQREEELKAEIQSHLDMATRDRMERGETAEQARASARREFGNVGLVKEVTREMWGWASLERLLQDLRFGLRMLRKNPGFSLIAILTLAMGIAANTTIFSVADALILRPFNFPNQQRLVMIWSQSLQAGFERTSPKRIMTVMMGVFAGIALLLAGMGLYAVMAYAVSQRTQEIGIRMALGAQVRDVLRLILQRGLTLVLAGLSLGLLASLAVTRWLKSLLFSVSATDPLTFGGVTLLLLLIALLACWLPARRATKVDPLIALRHE